MLILQSISYIHPDKEILFEDISLVVNKGDKAALIGNNGTGKSTLLKIMSGKLGPSTGTLKVDSSPYYVPQIFGQFNDLTVAQALRIDEKLQSLKKILDGQPTEENLSILNDDWTIEERCRQALAGWQMEGVPLEQKMGTLSGGQKARVFLAGIQIHKPEIVLLDEPSNHLDTSSRQILYDYIENTANTLIVVSHDRTLLNLLDNVYELGGNGINVYGGNYDFYATQKQIEAEVLSQNLKNKEKALRKARAIERESVERQQKLDARGRKKQEKAGLPTISMNTLRNNAEKSTARLKSVQAEKTGNIARQLEELRQELPDNDKMKMEFDSSSLHKGKVLVSAREINARFSDRLLWNKDVTVEIRSGERIVVKGSNGAGKTTLIKLILGELPVSKGTVERADVASIYIDQDYTLINNTLNVYEQAQHFNSAGLQEHEIKSRLNRFLFTRVYWDKPCKALSGGEKMRLMLCCLAISEHAPDIIVLDEPTNNLDIQNMEILTAAVNEYQGTVLVISHDEFFLKQIESERVINMDDYRSE